MVCGHVAVAPVEVHLVFQASYPKSPQIGLQNYDVQERSRAHGGKTERNDFSDSGSVAEGSFLFYVKGSGCMGPLHGPEQ